MRHPSHTGGGADYERDGQHCSRHPAARPPAFTTYFSGTSRYAGIARVNTSVPRAAPSVVDLDSFGRVVDVVVGTGAPIALA